MKNDLLEVHSNLLHLSSSLTDLWLISNMKESDVALSFQICGAQFKAFVT